MERMLEVMVANPPAAAAGLIAMLCFATWPLFRTRWAMLLVYIGNNVAFVLHYALLDHWTAVAMNGVMSLQTLVAIMLVRLPKLRWAYYALMPMLALACLATWQGWTSFLSGSAAAFSTLGRMQANELILRVLLLASTPFWAAHDLMVGSLPGLIADLLSMATGSVMLARQAPPIRVALFEAIHPLGQLVCRVALSRRPIAK
jgi:inner membrane protein